MQGRTSGVDQFESVVIGSGFGGAVTSYRLAEAGRSVCVLERGKTYAPGSFPRTPAEMATAFWDPSEGGHGMYDVWAFKHLDAVVASGLGGGSLIYANVLLRKDPHWFNDRDPVGGGYRRWPFSYQDLEPHYENAERMLAPQLLPYDLPTYRLDKTAVFEQAARQSGHDWSLVPLAVRFANNGSEPTPGEQLAEAPYGNLHGLPRRTCRLCAECDIGCNDGAKNSLDHTYLSAAKHHGAQIRTRSEVRRIARREDGRFEVSYVDHRSAVDGVKADTRSMTLVTVIADRVVLGAGALGSTYLLLKNRGGLAGLSPALGSRISGNGDLLGFLLNATDSEGRPQRVNAHRGPVITSAVRVDDGDIGAYIQDAGFPAFMAWLLETARPSSTARRVLSVAWRRFIAMLRRDWNPGIGADLRRLLGPAVGTATSMPLLGMGRDIADGNSELRNNLLTCDWKLNRSLPHFQQVRSTMQAVATAANADFEINPTWLFRRVATVHALGGCPSSDDPANGVVDRWGEAHGVKGLWVVDGGAIPGPVGPNPSLTIAAFADRAAERMLG